ncbi:MAG: ferritin-like domain-containing protein [Myxococcota bacterium]|nr:ferritin-like domain-containing protein [Myxococcota bacterium]
MEHASIAAFARFALQLLSVGAPPDLIVATQRAMADETRHAQLAFGLASAYAGRDLGPGPLSIDACLDATDLRALVATVFAEGCIGETLAAVEAREALEHACDPAVRAVLETIAVDETRHAELAWRTIAWAIATGGQGVRDAIEAAITQEGARVRGEMGADAFDAPNDREMLAHGLVSSGRRQQLRLATLAELVAPCARTLLAETRSAHNESATQV